MSVKGGNLGARVWSSQLLIDNQTGRTEIPTWPASLPAGGGVSCTYLGSTWAGPAVINRLDDLADQTRATNEERVTFDNLLLPPAGQPARSCEQEQKTVRGGMPPDGPASFARRLLQQTHWAFRDSDTLNHVGGPANSFQAICLVVTWGAVLWSTTPPPAPSLLQRDTMPSTTISIPPWQHGSLAGEGAAAAAAAGVQGELQSGAVWSPFCCTVSPGLTVPTNSPGGRCAGFVLTNGPPQSVLSARNTQHTCT